MVVMTMDPGDYGPGDLREDGAEGIGGGPPTGGGLGDAHPGGTLGSSRRQTLQLIEDTLEELSSPYLTGLPDSYRSELLVLEWLERLAETAGRGETIEGLAYYAAIDWITADVESELREYLRGVDAHPDETRPLEQDDHATSLVYIARLAAME